MKEQIDQISINSRVFLRKCQRKGRISLLTGDSNKTIRGGNAWMIVIFDDQFATRNCFRLLKKKKGEKKKNVCRSNTLDKGKIPAFTLESARGLKYRNNCFEWKLQVEILRGVQYRSSAFESHWNSPENANYIRKEQTFYSL